jgi:hypothetical protein
VVFVVCFMMSSSFMSFLSSSFLAFSFSCASCSPGPSLPNPCDCLVTTQCGFPEVLEGGNKELSVSTKAVVVENRVVGHVMGV